MGSYFSAPKQVTLVVSQPRSNSTAYLLGLLHNPAVVRAFNEPFFRFTQCALKEKGVRPVIAEHNTRIAKELVAGKKVAIEIMAGHTESHEEMDVILDYYASLCDKKLILTIRNPTNQIFSYLERKLNDALIGLGKDGLTKEQVNDMITGKQYHGYDQQKIREVMDQVEEEMTNTWNQTNVWIIRAHLKGFRILVVTSADLLSDPAETMKKTCAFIGMEYTDKMIDGWDDQTKKTKLVDLATEAWDPEHKNAWNGPTYNSTGIHAGKNEKDIQLPAEFDPVIKLAKISYGAAIHR